MRRGGGKQKGAGQERNICRQLSLWLTDNKNPNVLWRSAMSGGRSTLALKSGQQVNKMQSGDISAISEEGYAFIDRFYVEVKFYRDLSTRNAFFIQPSKLLTFWGETCAGAAKHGKLPLLIAKENYFPEIVVTSPTALNSLSRKWADPFSTAKVTIEGKPDIKPFVALMLDAFLASYGFYDPTPQKVAVL